MVWQREDGAVSDLILTDCCFWARGKSGGRRWGGGAVEGAGFIFQSMANARGRELPVVLPAHLAIAPLPAPQQGHSHKEKDHKRTGREPGPYGSLLPKSSAINEEFTSQLLHWTSREIMVVKVTSTKGKKMQDVELRMGQMTSLSFALPDFPNTLLV